MTVRRKLVFTAIVAALAWSGMARAAEHRWTTYANPRFGAAADYPAELFTVRDRPPENGDGQTFHTADNRAALSVFGTNNVEEDSPGSYVGKYFKGPEVTYKHVTRRYFVVSGARNGEIFYQRCNFPAAADGAIVCVNLTYPEREKAQWDAIVTRISKSLRVDDHGVRQ